MKPSNKDIIRALRCISTPGGPESCEGCAYSVKKRMDGEEYIRCDFDKIGLDAADLLELLTVCQQRDEEELPDDTGLTASQRGVVLVYAACNMRITPARAILGKGAGTMYATMDKIQANTGLDPRNFYDLARLVEAAKDTDSADCKACKQSHPWCGGCCNTCSDPCNASQRCRRAGNG